MNHYRFEGKVYRSHSKEKLARRICAPYISYNRVKRVVRMDLVVKRIKKLVNYKERKK
jgi:hypothetical protein